MKRITRWAVLLIILVPILFTWLVTVKPESRLVSAASQRARSAIEQGQYPMAAADLRQVISISPWRSDLLEELGHVEFQLKRYDRAISAFQSARENNTLSFDSVVELGQSYVEMNRQGDAQDLWRRMSEKPSHDPVYQLKIARNQRKIGDTFGTIATLLQAYHLAPADAEINYLLGIHLAVTQPDSSIKFLKVAASSALYLKKTSQNLLTILESEDLDEALRFMQIGQVLSNAGEWDMAAIAFDAVVRLDEKNALGWALLGEAVQHEGKDGEAELRKALDLDPTLDMANALMALYYRRQNQPEKALIYLKRAAEANPTEGVWQAEIGNTLADMGDLSSALEYYLKGTEIAPEDPVVWQALAEFAFAHNLDAATTGISAARKALSLDPGNPLLLDLMGTGFLITGDLDSAERFLQQAVEADEFEATIHLHLGQLYIQKNDCEKATEELRGSQTLTSDDRILSNVQRLLKDYCAGY